MGHGSLKPLAAAAAIVVLSAPGVQAASDAAEIRALRLAYNHVIEARDAAAFEKFLAPTFVEMTSGGEVTRGARAVADSYAADEFKDPSFIAYDRRPDTIVVSPNRRFAVERGHWRTRFRRPAGKTGPAGLYQAGWVRTDGRWRIQTESYVRLTCRRGSAC